MPDTVGKQDPYRLLDLLDSLAAEKEESNEYTGNDPYLKMFYGQ